MVIDNKAIGVVLDMAGEPHIYILEEYRKQGYGFTLLKKYFVKNDLLLRNKYVFCNYNTEEGLALIKKLKLRE